MSKKNKKKQTLKNDEKLLNEQQRKANMQMLANRNKVAAYKGANNVDNTTYNRAIESVNQTSYKGANDSNSKTVYKKVSNVNDRTAYKVVSNVNEQNAIKANNKNVKNKNVKSKKENNNKNNNNVNNNNVKVNAKKKEDVHKKAIDDARYFQLAQEIVSRNQEAIDRKKSIEFLIIAILTFLFVAVLGIGSVAFGIAHEKRNTIAENISVLGIDVSGKTIEEAKNLVNEKLTGRTSNDWVFQYKEQTFTLLPEAINFQYNVDEAVAAAYKIGRTGNIFEKNLEVVKQHFTKKNYIPTISYDQSLYEIVIPQVDEILEDGLKQPEYTIEDDEVKIITGKDGYQVDAEELKERIENKMLAAEYNSDPIEIPVIYKEADEIDIEKIYNEIYTAPVEATYTANPYTITASKTGLDFAITLDEAKELVAQSDGEEVSIPLTVLEPAVKTEDLGLDAFPNELASYSTNYARYSGANRSRNIELATANINGTVLMPGEEFSYNGVVGQRTAARGFKAAGAYANGQVVNTIGGGICQVSSTLYNAVLRANLEVTERHNHMFQVAYCPIGTDATVSWGYPDFKFKNNRTYPIKIVATTSGGYVYFKIYGLAQDDDYEIEIYSYKTGSVAPKTTYTKGYGAGVVVQSASYGATSVTYKIYKKNGVEVKREQISSDYYYAHNKIVSTS